MKTVLELSKELGVSKQKLYRYVKKHYDNDVHYINNVMYIDDVLQDKLIEYFNNKKCLNDIHRSESNDTEMIQLLKQQLIEKDKQIEQYQELLKNQQILTLQANKKVELLENSEDNKYQKVFLGLYKKKCD